MDRIEITYHSYECPIYCIRTCLFFFLWIRTCIYCIQGQYTKGIDTRFINLQGLFYKINVMKSIDPFMVTVVLNFFLGKWTWFGQI